MYLPGLATTGVVFLGYLNVYVLFCVFVKYLLFEDSFVLKGVPGALHLVTGLLFCVPVSPGGGF